MPNTKKGRTGKCGNIMVPVKVVPTFVHCEKRAVKIAQHKLAKKCVTLPRQKRIDLFAPTTARNNVCFSVNKCIHPAKTHSTIWPFSNYIRYNNGTFSTKMKITLQVVS